jgi:tetratricopeptide (TPR) repeat protein
MRRLALILALVAADAAADPWVWVDAKGITHIRDDPADVPARVREQAGQGREALRGLWDDVRGPIDAMPSDGGSQAEDRTQRLIRGAVADLERGETARAQVALESVLRDEPAQPEAHWYLALLERQRGRYDSAQAHLEAFLASAGDDLEPWRASARRRLAALVDEEHLATPTPGATTEFVRLSTPHFRVHYDAALGRASPDYARTVIGYLEEARAATSERLGAEPQEAMGVVFYGKAAYLEAHRHRFSFQTVGFFDGRIHVVSAGHPAGELRALLFHEYTHAIFREQTGGDRPYWLNEGLAEVAERGSRERSGLTRSELVALRSRIDERRWLPLRRLAPSFSGLDDTDARAAYLEALAAADWIEAHSDRAQRKLLLERLGQGASDDEALRAALHVDTDAIDAAVRERVRREFPSPALRSAQSE